MFSSRNKGTQIENYDEKSEKYYMKKAYDENYGFWFNLGSFYPRPGIVPMLFIPTALFFNVIFAMSAINLNNDEIAIRSESVHFIVFLTIELTAMITFMCYKETIDQIYRQMGQRFHDYENTLDKECYEVISNTYKSGRTRKKIFHNVFVGCSMSTFLTAIIARPILSYYKGDPDPNDGILRMIPVPLWTPFKKSWYVTLIFFIGEYIIAYATPGIIFGCILFVVCSCEDIGAQFIILGYTLKNVAQRAKGLNMPKDQALKLCFSHSIRHHQTLLKSIKSLEKFINIPAFILLFGSTFLMCMSGFIFVAKEVAIISKTVFGLFLLSELAIIFLICWCGEFIQNTSSSIFEMVYSSEWQDNMESMKSNILIIQVMSIRPITLNFGGLMVASLETFSNICSSAFSYFNLMLAMN